MKTKREMLFVLCRYLSFAFNDFPTALHPGLCINTLPLFQFQVIGKNKCHEALFSNKLWISAFNLFTPR
jgi:hypothetical protein